MRSDTQTRVRFLLAPILVGAAFVACGGAVNGGSDGPPGPVTHSDGGVAPEAGSVVGDCSDGTGCPDGSSCYFAIGSCSAQGKCIENPSPGTPECGAIEYLCGCDGGPTVYTGCGYPDGYASGPTTGEGSCGGISPPSEPGFEAGAPEAGQFQEAGQFFDGNQGDTSIPLPGCLVPETGASPCSPACDQGEVCVVQAGPDIGCPDTDGGVDSGIDCGPGPASCQPTPACFGASACDCYVGTFCSDSSPGGPDAGAYGTAGVLGGGAVVVSCENGP